MATAECSLEKPLNSNPCISPGMPLLLGNPSKASMKGLAISSGRPVPLGSRMLPVITFATFFSPISTCSTHMTKLLHSTILGRTVSKTMTHRQRVTSTFIFTRRRFYIPLLPLLTIWRTDSSSLVPTLSLWKTLLQAIKQAHLL